MYSYEEVKKLIESNGSVLISKEYKNSVTPLNIKCGCGNKFNKTLKIMKKSGLFMCNDCVKTLCAKRQTLPYSELKKRIEGRGFILHTKEEEYSNSSEKCYVECPNGHKYNQYPYDIFSGHGCKKCASKINGEKNRKSYNELTSYIEKYGYKLLTSKEDYINTGTKIEMICDKGHKYSATFDNFRSGARCPECFNQKRGVSSLVPYLKRKEFVESFGYSIVTTEDEYENASQTITLKCDKGHEYETCISSFMNGYRCTICNESKGERRVRNFLELNNISFIQQYKFKECRCKRKLPFDFYIPSLNLCIEYDGRQHYEIIEAFGGINGFIETKIRDTIKNDFCKKNNIKLIRIPYWDFKNVEMILKKELKLLK